MKNNFAKKTIKILIGVVFVFMLTSPSFVKASHPFRYDENLNTAQNLEKTGHPELYEAIMAEMKKNNYDEKTYEGIYAKILSESKNEDAKQQIKDNKSGENFTFTLLQPLPTESGGTLSTNVTLKQYLTWAYKFVLALIGFLAVMMIVIGGVEYIISGANESMRGEAHKRIWGAITGLILALVAYLILYTINPSLVNFEDNWFFKPRNTQMQNGKTTQANIIDNSKIINLFPKQEGESGTVIKSINSTGTKTDGENTYNTFVQKDAVQYKDGSIKYTTMESYTDKNNYRHDVLTKKDVHGTTLYSGEVIDYGGSEGMKFFIGGKEVKQSEFNK